MFAKYFIQSSENLFCYETEVNCFKTRRFDGIKQTLFDFEKGTFWLCSNF